MSCTVLESYWCRLALGSKPHWYILTLMISHHIRTSHSVELSYCAPRIFLQPGKTKSRSSSAIRREPEKTGGLYRIHPRAVVRNDGRKVPARRNRPKHCNCTSVPRNPIAGSGFCRYVDDAGAAVDTAGPFLFAAWRWWLLLLLL